MLVTENTTPTRARAESTDYTYYAPENLKLLEKMDDLQNLQETSTSTNNSNKLIKDPTKTPEKGSDSQPVKYETAHQLTEES